MYADEMLLAATRDRSTKVINPTGETVDRIEFCPLDKYAQGALREVDQPVFAAMLKYRYDHEQHDTDGRSKQNVGFAIVDPDKRESLTKAYAVDILGTLAIVRQAAQGPSAVPSDAVLDAAEIKGRQPKKES
ncbi:MAG TPA: hypothetical protein PKX17_05870 [Candidatus Methanomethylicus sp.]|nr:hypothetical protein [Candidatus Methanomethylicus sp.]